MPRCCSAWPGCATCWARRSARRCARANGVPLKPLIARGLGHGRRDAPEERRLHGAVPARDRALAGAHVRRRHEPGRGAGLHRRQRPVLPQHRHGDRQGHDRPGAQHRRASIVTAMCRNGTDFGIRVSGTGDRLVHGAGGNAGRPLFPRLLGRRRQPGHGRLGHRGDHRARRLRHGGGAGGGRFRRRRLGGGRSRVHRTACARSRWRRTPSWTIPALDFAGVATGIDVRLVAETGIAPAINTGIAHKKPGVGQVGAGVVRAPMACFSCGSCGAWRTWRGRHEREHSQRRAARLLSRLRSR